jgi:uncharacterized RDD family membrane protein YckC
MRAVRTMTHPEMRHDGEDPAPVQPPVPPPASAGQQDVPGLRAAAALIDLVPLAGLFVITASTADQVTAGGGSFSVWLSPAWAAASAAIAMLCYLAVEARSGQMAGKPLPGAQVRGPGRARPPVWPVAGRALAQVVDFLPVTYLAGFVTILATGARRRRTGDLAARTATARSAPARHRGRAAAPLAIVVLAAGLSACGATSPARSLTYRAHGISFDYPAGWQEQTGYTSTSAGAAKLWGTAVGPGTPHDLITVEAYPVSPAVTAQNIDAVSPDLEGALRHAGLAVQGTPKKITMAGMPGLRFRVTGNASGTPYASALVFAFNGTTEYEVDCQYTSGMAAKIERACDQVTGSFHVSRAASGAAAPATSARAPGATSAAQPSASAPGSSAASRMPGTGGLGATVVPAPAGFALSQRADVHNGPMSAAGFNQWTGAGNLAASLHFVRGYDVTYDSNTSSDTIEVTLFQFATPADAANFKAGFTPGGPASSRADPVIPGGDDYDSTAPSQGTYDHGVIATRGYWAFVIDDATGSAAPVPLVETMARRQYAAL